MGSKLILLLSLLVGALLTFICINKDKNALVHKYKDIEKVQAPVATLPTQTTQERPVETPTKEITEEENPPKAEEPKAEEPKVEEPKVEEPQLATPIFSYTVGDKTKLSAKLSTKDKTKEIEKFILKYCPAENCIQDLNFEDETKEATWRVNALKIAAFLKDKNVKDGAISIGGNLLNIEGELANDEEMDELNKLLSLFDSNAFKIENITKVSPPKQEKKAETLEEPTVEKTIKDVEKDIADKLRANPVLFEFNSSTITKKSQNILDDIVETLKNYPDVNLIVEGHTDAKGRASYNKWLSQQRADSVKRYLKKYLQNSIQAIGFGESRPITSNPRDEANRRVEIHLKEGE